MSRPLLPQGSFVSTIGSVPFDSGGGPSVSAVITRALVQHVVMLSYPRSGTGWLCDLIDQHPKLVLDPGEPMHFHRQGANATETVRRFGEFLARDAMLTHHATHHGFKWMFNQGISPDPPMIYRSGVDPMTDPYGGWQQPPPDWEQVPSTRGWASTLGLNQFKIINLVRTNVLAELISGARGHRRAANAPPGKTVAHCQTWDVKCQRVAAGKPELDPSGTVRELHRKTALHQLSGDWVRTHFPEAHFRITYEHLAADPDTSLQRIFEFLGLERLETLDLSTTVVPTAHEDMLGDSISNPHEVAQALSGTPWQGWLSSSSIMSAAEAWAMAHDTGRIGTRFAVLDNLGWHSRMCQQAALEVDECQKDWDMAAATLNMESVVGVDTQETLSSSSSRVVA